MSTHFHEVWGIANDWDKASIIALFLAVIGQASFVLIFGSREWWVIRVGRALFSKAAGLLLVLLLTVTNTFVTYPHEDVVGAVATVILTLTIWYQLYALIRTPRGSYFARRRP